MKLAIGKRTLMLGSVTGVLVALLAVALVGAAGIVGWEYSNSCRSSASVSSASDCSRERAPCGEYRVTRTSRSAPLPRTNTSPNSSRSYWVIRPPTPCRR